MPDISTGSTSIPFGTNLRIGYRVNGSTGGYTYISYYPSYNELPYTYTLPSPGTWQIEYTVVCPTCNSSQYSDPETTLITVA